MLRLSNYLAPTTDAATGKAQWTVGMFITPFDEGRAKNRGELTTSGETLALVASRRRQHPRRRGEGGRS